MSNMTQEQKARIYGMYLGCEVIAPPLAGSGQILRGHLTGYHGEYGPEVQFIEDGNASEEPAYPDFPEDGKVKLLLRPLSAMAKAEIYQLLSEVYKGIYHTETIFTHIEILREDSDAVGLRCVDPLDSANIGFTVERQRGVEFSTNGNKLMVDQFQATAWLLSKGFDLFGLIESEHAIDATKQSLPEPPQ